MSGLSFKTRRAMNVLTASGTVVTMTPAMKILAKKAPPLARYASTA
jgi:hypothetical protein